MGVHGSREDHLVNKDIGVKMKKSHASSRFSGWQDQRTQKLLLLGAGESGKTTFMKQMRHIYGNQFLAEERMHYKSFVWENIIETIQTLILKAETFRDYEDGPQFDDENEVYVSFMKGVSRIHPFTEDVCLACKTLWTDNAIEAAYRNRNRFAVLDTAEWFFGKDLDRFVGDDFVPTFEDITRCRVRTTGIKTESFEYEDIHFELIDIGGQRSERRKWLHYFTDCTGVIFVCSLAGYNQVIFEDERINRLAESLETFEKYINMPAFLEMHVILFLNKSDLFEPMIARVPFTVCVPDYAEDPHNYDGVINYIREAFRRRFREGAGRRIYTHVTCATNTENVRLVFTDVKHIIISQYLEQSALIAR